MTSQQIQYFNLLENERSNRAKEDLTQREQDLNYSMKERELAEKTRANKAQERRTTRQINETTRSNKAREAENERSNRAKEAENFRSNVERERETAQHNRATEMESHLHNSGMRDIHRYDSATNRLRAETEAKYAPFKNWQTSAAYFGEGLATHFAQPIVDWFSNMWKNFNSPEASAQRAQDRAENQKYLLDMMGGGLNPTPATSLTPKLEP